MKKINDERIIIKNYETIARTFTVLVLLCIGYISFYNVFSFLRETPQLIIFFILIITSIYFISDSFFSKTLLPEVQGKTDIRKKIGQIAISIFSFNILLIYVLLKETNIALTFSKIVLLILGIIGVDIILFAVSYLSLRIWIKWLNM